MQIVTILTNGFADWETALLNAAAASFYGCATAYATPDGAPVTSSGGMKVTPDLSIAQIEPSALDALIVCGGTAWSADDAPDIGALLRATHDAEKVVGLICDATLAGARSGLLDALGHTSNGAGHLDPTGYAGNSHYKDVPHAISAAKVVTAPGTAPVSFMGAVMGELGFGDARLDYYLGLHAAQFEKN